MTLNKTIAKLGEKRIQRAITAQKRWLGKKHHFDVCYFFVECWNMNPRQAVKWLRFATSFAGFKSSLDTYLLMAYALGKLPFVK